MKDVVITDDLRAAASVMNVYRRDRANPAPPRHHGHYACGVACGRRVLGQRPTYITTKLTATQNDPEGEFWMSTHYVVWCFEDQVNRDLRMVHRRPDANAQIAMKQTFRGRWMPQEWWEDEFSTRLTLREDDDEVQHANELTSIRRLFAADEEEFGEMEVNAFSATTYRGGHGRGAYVDPLKWRMSPHDAIDWGPRQMNENAAIHPAAGLPRPRGGLPGAGEPYEAIPGEEAPAVQEEEGIEGVIAAQRNDGRVDERLRRLVEIANGRQAEAHNINVQGA